MPEPGNSQCRVEQDYSRATWVASHNVSFETKNLLSRRGRTWANHILGSCQGSCSWRNGVTGSTNTWGSIAQKRIILLPRFSNRNEVVQNYIEGTEEFAIVPRKYPYIGQRLWPVAIGISTLTTTSQIWKSPRGIVTNAVSIMMLGIAWMLAPGWPQRMSLCEALHLDRFVLL